MELLSLGEGGLDEGALIVRRFVKSLAALGLGRAMLEQLESVVVVRDCLGEVLSLC